MQNIWRICNGNNNTLCIPICTRHDFNFKMTPVVSQISVGRMVVRKFCNVFDFISRFSIWCCIVGWQQNKTKYHESGKFTLEFDTLNNNIICINVSFSSTIHKTIGKVFIEAFKAYVLNFMKDSNILRKLNTKNPKYQNNN